MAEKQSNKLFLSDLAKNLILFIVFFLVFIVLFKVAVIHLFSINFYNFNLYH
jgi:hypothetical protein